MKTISSLIILLSLSIISIAQPSVETIIIGNQEWMKYPVNAGVMITTTQSDNNIVEKYCYNNLESNCTKYGGLYDWGEAMAYSVESGARGICPAGFRIPTKVDIDTLFVFLGGQSVAGPKLKSITGWESKGLTCTPQPTNESGFSAIAGGTRWSNGVFKYAGSTAVYWTSTEVPEYSAAWYFGVRYCTTTGTEGMFYKDQASSIRCIKQTVK